MALNLALTYASGADLRTFLVDQMSHGAVLLPVDGDLSQVCQFEEVTLDIVAGGARGQLRAQVLQVLPGTGLVLELADLAELDLLLARAGGSDQADAPRHPPTVERAAMGALRQLDALDESNDTERPPWDEQDDLADPDGSLGAMSLDEADNTEGGDEVDNTEGGDEVDNTEGGDEADDNEGGDEQDDNESGDEQERTVNQRRPASAEAGVPLGSSPVSWSIELLLSRWDNLSLADKVRVARYGKRPARGLVLRGLDKTLHIHLLHNPGLTAEEVAQMAGLATMDPVTLKRIAQSSEWQKQASVAKALICNPKFPLPLIPGLLRNVPRTELSRLARTGKVRASVKEAIVKHLDRTR